MRLRVALLFILLEGFCSSQTVQKKSLNHRTNMENDWSTTGDWDIDLNNGRYETYRDGNGTLTTGFWSTVPARRLLLKLKIKPKAACKNENDTDCLIRFAYWRADSKTDTPIYSNTNITFPNETFLDTNFYTTEVSINGMSNKSGIFMKFETTKFLGYFESVDLEYYICPSVTEELVDFDSEAAPDEIEKERQIKGRCTQNADLQGATPYMVCRYDGTYTITGNCVCIAGYKSNNGKCTACDIGYFKPSKGNIPCTECGMNSKPGEVPREDCECLTGFYRSKSTPNEPTARCYEYPKWKRGNEFDVKFPDISKYDATMEWTAPSPGSAPLGIYVLQCMNCPPAQNFTVRTNSTNATLTDLLALATYEIEITNINSVTELTGRDDRRTFEFTTKQGAPGVILSPTYTTLSDGSVQFSWDNPFGLGSKNYIFVVTYGDQTLKIKTNSFTIKTDLQDREYTVQIHTESVVDRIRYKSKAYIVVVTVKGGIPLALALGVAFGILIFVVIALIAAFCIWKRRNPAYLQVIRMPDGTVKLPARFYSGGKVYVDPKKYPDVDDAVNEFAFEISRQEMKVGDKIGEGEFCDVYKGTLFKNGKSHSVAIKMLKPGATKMDRDDFMSEAAILGQFSDPNVIFLQGVVLRDEPNAILLEYMSCGSLNKYLQEHDNEFTTIELLEMGRGIASGMKYLSEIGFIHRDLAARNILVNENGDCKISDFGMSVEIKFDETSESMSGKIPVRWTAPEAIQFKQFTTASDVWSYGIVLWEIMSYGERPYWDWTNYQVLEKVTSGFRLPPPMSCPGVVHDLMLQCWTKDRSRRPLFSIIRDKLDIWIRHPDLLEGSTIIELDDNLDYTIMQTINKWLEAIQMGRYSKNFIEQGFATPRQILLFTTTDLEKLGIGPLDHQKRIMKAIENTRKQVEAQVVRRSSVVGNSYAV